MKIYVNRAETELGAEATIADLVAGQDEKNSFTYSERRQGRSNLHIIVIVFRKKRIR